MSEPASQARFVQLIEDHGKILFKVTSTYCRNRADQEDLTQEMIFQLWRSFGRYDDRLRFSTWMYRVALNVAISFVRQQTRRRRITLPGEEAILQVAAPPSQSASLKDDLALLQELIEQLDEIERAIVLLYLDGNSYETIAEIVGISETNVGTKISRIKQKLRGLSTEQQKGSSRHGT